MRKKEILNQMRKRLNISKEEAEEMFQDAIKEGEIQLIINWKTIIDYLIIAMVLISGLYALLNIFF